VRRDPEGMTVRKMSHLLFFDPENLEGARGALRVGSFAPGWRGSCEEGLVKAGAVDWHAVVERPHYWMRVVAA
jgi:YiiM-like, 3-alpha helix domain